MDDRLARRLDPRPSGRAGDLGLARRAAAGLLVAASFPRPRPASAAQLVPAWVPSSTRAGRVGFLAATGVAPAGARGRRAVGRPGAIPSRTVVSGTGRAPAGAT